MRRPSRAAGSGAGKRGGLRLLVFNLATDADDPLLGFAVEWLRSLASSVRALDVITMRAGCFALPGHVEVRSVGAERGRSRVGRALAFYGILGGLLRRHRYDAALAHMTPLFAAMAGPLLHARGIPLALWYARGGAASRALRIAARWADTIATPSRGSFPLPHARVVVTGHGIDTDRFSPDPEARPEDDRTFRVISVGRVAPVKHLEILVDAAGHLQAAGAPRGIGVALVGPVLAQDRAYAENLRGRVAAAGLEGIVALEGPLAPALVPARLRAADAAVNVSATDSVDKAALEAMACGLPVVVSNPALVPIVEAVDARCVVPLGDARALAGRLAWLAGMSRVERAALGAALRAAVVRDHSLRRLTRRLMDDVLVRPRSASDAAGRGA